MKDLKSQGKTNTQEMVELKAQYKELAFLEPIEPSQNKKFKIDSILESGSDKSRSELDEPVIGSSHHQGPKREGENDPSSADHMLETKMDTIKRDILDAKLRKKT